MQIYRIKGSEAVEELWRLRAEYAATGLYPILFGGEEDYERVAELMPKASAVAVALEESRSNDLTTRFREKAAVQDTFSPTEGEWPGATGGIDLMTHLDLGGKPLPRVVIGLLPVAAPWEVFAHLGWGGWNDCPFAAEHCALHRDWSLRYGAEVVSITGDVVQCLVSRPPGDRAGSEALAREHYLYCYDIVEQGTQTLAALAGSLLNSDYWYFWWD